MATAPRLPDPVAAGQALATLNDWRAIMAVQMFVIVALMGFIVWREFSLVGLRRAIDKMTSAIWQMRLGLIRDQAEREEAAKAEREE